MKLFSISINTARERLKYVSEVEGVDINKITIPLYCKHHGHNIDGVVKTINTNFLHNIINDAN